jgi:hypothetical protein
VLGLGKLVVKLGIAKGRIDQRGVIILVERAAQIQHTAIQHQVAVGRGCNRAHAEVVGQAIERFFAPVGLQHRLQAVEMGRARIPQHRLRHGHLDGMLLRARCNDAALIGRVALRVGQGQQQAVARGRGLVQVQHHMRTLASHIGRDLQARDMGSRARFQRHALPDAAERPIPTLLAVRDLGKGKLRKALLVLVGVDHAHNQFVSTVEANGRVGHELEGQIAALVVAQVLAVEPDASVVIDRAEAKQPGCRLKITTTAMR